VLAQQEIDDAKAMLPEHVFRELYLAEPSDDGGNPFGLAHIRSCIRGGLGEKPIVCWGVDLAKSHDWTVAIGLNDAGEVAAFQRWQADWKNTTLRVAAMLKDVPALVDATGVGDPIVEGLQRRCGNVEGYKFNGTPTGKQQLMEGLAVAIQNQRVTFPNGQIVTELESFEYEVRVVEGRVKGVSYSAPAGLHDDCVCALALAVRCMQTAPMAPRLVMCGPDEEVDVFASDYDPHEDERLWQSY
jgi:phage FluMu gp28-like protein